MKKKILYIILPALLYATACRKQLEQQPQASLDATTGYTTRQGVEAGIIGVYDGIQLTGYMSLNYLIFPDMYADNIQEVGTFPTFAQVYNKTILPDNVDIATIWNAIYSTINRANNIIAAAPAITDPAFAKDRAIGECEAIRAMAYFDLIRMFGGSPDGYNKAGGLGVPLRLKPTLTPADAKAVTPRATEAAIYTQVLQDLDDAIAKLPVSVGAGRVNKLVATALKSRVQLYRQQWADAEANATTVIASGSYSLVSGANYLSMYSQTTTSETIWALLYNATDANSIAFYYYPTSSGGRNEISSTPSLRDAFEAGDIRKPINFSTTPANKQLKYSQVSPGIDNVMMFRLAEIYLTRAEARAQQNNLTGALTDLNVIRSRAGLSPSTAVTQADILTAIIKERRLELAHEGQRFFDLRRVNQTGITQTFRNLFPIPQPEVLSSGGVTAQNPNY